MESPVKKSKISPDQKQSIIQRFLEDQENMLLDSIDDPLLFQELVGIEETLISSIYASSDSVLEKNSPGTTYFQEDIDLRTAESRLQGSKKAPVPDYLLRYMNANLHKPEQKKRLIVRLSQAGVQVFESLKEGLNMKPNLAFSPGLRSAATAPSTANDSGFVVFEETVQNGQRFFYQMVRETAKEVFLSIKIDSENPEENYRQVILRKDGRFILSNKINPEGVVNFGGLTEGEYSVEFLGRDTNKFVDLYLIVD